MYADDIAPEDQSPPAITATSNLEQVGVFGEFRSAEIEERYRREQLRNDAPQATVFLVVVLIADAVFVVSDYRLFGVTTQFSLLLGVRALLVLASLVVMMTLTRAETPRRFDRILLAWGVIAVACATYISSTRPPAYSGHAIVTVFLVLALYSALPLPLLPQTVLALLLSLGTASLLIGASSPNSELTGLAVLVSLVLANALGVGLSTRLNRWKRHQWLALARETDLRVALERAVAEIKTLRGIIPICASCKRIRDDAGYWQQVEVYVRDHSHAEFSHGLCPDCMKTLLTQERR